MLRRAPAQLSGIVMKQAKGHVPFLERAKILGNVRGLAHSDNDLPIPAEFFLQLSTYLSHISGDNHLAMLDFLINATLLHEFSNRICDKLARRPCGENRLTLH